LKRLRFPLLFFTFISLLLAMWAGLIRAGWDLSPLHGGFAIAHGPLMIAGFLGTLISLERAVALGGFLRDSPARHLPYLVPLLSIAGAASLVLDLSLAAFFITLSSAGLCLIFAYIISRQPAIFTVTMGLGAVTWLIGNVIWLAGDPIYTSVPWWIGFLVLTITGERLELSRLLQISYRLHLVFAGLVGMLLVGIGLTQINDDLGMRLMGIGQIALAVWLLRYDVIRRTIRQTGVTRYIAVCLFLGYAWLGVSGGMSLYFGSEKVGFRYDAILHSVFLGFVFSMIFGHALLILPSVVQIELTYSPLFYGHLALLHLSLLLRVSGDLWVWLPGRHWGAMLNAIVLLLFLVNTARTSSVAQKLSHTRVARVVYFLLPIMAIALFVVGIEWVGQSKTEKSPESLTTNGEGDREAIRRGKSTFQAYCSSCHGMDARGLPHLGKDLIASPFVQGLSDAELHNFIVRGRPVWDLANTTGIDMPSRGGFPRLTDEQIDDIIAYLRSGG
jgi:mono/diheme cytochrome c family protein